MNPLQSDQKASKKVSIIIPNLNSSIIDQTVAALHRQDFDLSQVEVLIVGRDELGLIQDDELVRCITGPKELTPTQNRNFGILQSSGELLCFTDADCLPEPDWLMKLTAPYADPQVCVVGGGVRFTAETYWSLCDNLSWFAPNLVSAEPGTRLSLPTLNFSLRRSVIEKAGPMDERYPVAGGEDTEWTLRIRAKGYPLHFIPDAIVYHCPNRADLASLWRHGYIYGRYSPMVDSEAEEYTRDLWQKRIFPEKSWALFLSSPLLALGATASVLTWHRSDWQMWKALPGIWLSKVAWCLGAAHAMQKGFIGESLD